MVYEWKNGSRISANPSKVGSEIESMGLEVTPQDLILKAKNKKTELHKCFEWDDSVAGEKYREAQARNILKSLVIIQEVEKDEEPEMIKIRAFENVKVNDTQFYTPILHALSEENLLTQVKARLLKTVNECLNIAENYEHVVESFSHVKKHIEKAKKYLE